MSMLGQKWSPNGTKIPQHLGANQNNTVIKMPSLALVTPTA